MTNYWLAQWLDDNEVKSDRGIDRLLRSEKSRKLLTETSLRAAQAQESHQYHYPSRGELGDSVVAGRRIDLSASLTCPAFDCLRKNIDFTFKRVWHYFDRIVVEGLSPRVVFQGLRSENGPDHALMLVAQQAQLFLYLRQTGADRYTIFTRKSLAFCQQHWLEHAKELGIDDALDDAKSQKIVRTLIRSSKFEIEQARPGFWYVKVSGAALPASDGMIYEREEPPTREQIATSLVGQYATAMISDVEVARRLTLPLIEPTSIPWKRAATRNTSTRPSAADVALEIRLPVFDRLSTRDFIKLREDHQPEFETYRAALRKAIRDILDSKSDVTSAAEAAWMVEQEFLRPGLAEIERKVSGGRKALAKKIAVDLTLGTVATTVSTMSAIPLMITSGVMALGGAVQLVPMINKYIEDRATIQLSDLYFLWQAEREADHK